jgi:hypothetical protein
LDIQYKSPVFRLKGKVLSGEFGLVNREYSILNAKFADVGSDVWGVNKTGKVGLDLLDDSFLVVGKVGEGCNRAVDECQNFDSPSTRRVGYFEDGHDRVELSRG